MILEFIDKAGSWVANRKSRTTRFFLFLLVFFLIFALFVGTLSLIVWMLFERTTLFLIIFAVLLIGYLAISFAWELSE